jgi:hypothetical protein
MSWHKIEITVEDSANGKQYELEKEFSTIFWSLNAPKNIALFGSRNIYTFPFNYFITIPDDSETVTQLFQGVFIKYRAKPCNKPIEGEVKSVLGSHSNDLLK